MTRDGLVAARPSENAPGRSELVHGGTAHSGTPPFTALYAGLGKSAARGRQWARRPDKYRQQNAETFCHQGFFPDPAAPVNPNASPMPIYRNGALSGTKACVDAAFLASPAPQVLLDPRCPDGLGCHQNACCIQLAGQRWRSHSDCRGCAEPTLRQSRRFGLVHALRLRFNDLSVTPCRCIPVAPWRRSAKH